MGTLLRSFLKALSIKTGFFLLEQHGSGLQQSSNRNKQDCSASQIILINKKSVWDFRDFFLFV